MLYKSRLWAAIVKKGIKVSASSSAVDGMPVKSMAVLSPAGEFSVRTVFNMRHELVEAQVEVLRMYVEKKPGEALLGALDRLIECTRASFSEEEALMELLASTPDPKHRDMHHELLAQMELLRRDVEMEFDRGRLLAQLILVDRQLTAHISDVVGVSDSRQFDRLPERETAAA